MRTHILRYLQFLQTVAELCADAHYYFAHSLNSPWGSRASSMCPVRRALIPWATRAGQKNCSNKRRKNNKNSDHPLISCFPDGGKIIKKSWHFEKIKAKIVSRESEKNVNYYLDAAQNRIFHLEHSAHSSFIRELHLNCNFEPTLFYRNLKETARI